MNKQIVKINNSDLSVKELNGQRVVTFKDIDMLHERVLGTADRNFRENKKHLIENEDYFIIPKSQNNEIRGLEIPNRGITLLTESGYLMLVKSLQDDLAWKVQRELVNNYFRVKNLSIRDIKQEISTLIDEKFEDKLSEVKEYYKIKAKTKSDITSYIKKRLGVIRADDEYEQVKARVFLMLGIRKWEDLNIDKYTDVINLIDESIKVVKDERPQQVNLWD